jgi:hypothetical protein
MPIIRTKPQHQGTLVMLATSDATAPPRWDFLNILRFLKDLVTSPFSSKDATGASLDNLGDLQALIRAKDLEFAQLQDELVKKSATWAKRNMPAWYDWQSDFAALQARYAAAKAMADKVVQGRLSRHTQIGPDTPGPEMAGWVRRGGDLILAALRKVPGQTTKGDLQDLQSRIAQALTAAAFIPTPVWVPGRPSPSPSQPALPPIPQDLAIPADDKPGHDKPGPPGLLDKPLFLAGAAATFTAAMTATAFALLKKRDSSGGGIPK